MAAMDEKQTNILERFLGLFTEVHGGEAVTVILLILNLFILLTAYLVIKTVREPLILTGGGAEIKSYAAAGHALLLLLVVPLGDEGRAEAERFGVDDLLHEVARRCRLAGECVEPELVEHAIVGHRRSR